MYDDLIHWPTGDGLKPSFLRTTRYGILDRKTRIGSIGSCFAREIKHWLKENGYTYVQTSDSPNAAHSSAAWDRVYNPCCLRQEFERALSPGSWRPKIRVWRTSKGLFDPYRQAVSWRNEEEMEEELVQHAEDARKALLSSEAFIVTVGLNEVWMGPDDSAAYQRPPSEILSAFPGTWRLVVPSVERNVEELRRIVSLMRERNPSCRLIFTLSPVPLQASFRENVVLANARSKAALLLAVREVCEREGCFYFPAYEMVTSVLRDPFDRVDNRHVRREAVAEIMDLFRWTYARDE